MDTISKQIAREFVHLKQLVTKLEEAQQSADSEAAEDTGEPALPACPFCGAEVSAFDLLGGRYRARCADYEPCGFWGPIRPTKNEALQAVRPIQAEEQGNASLDEARKEAHHFRELADAHRAELDQLREKYREQIKERSASLLRVYTRGYRSGLYRAAEIAEDDADWLNEHGESELSRGGSRAAENIRRYADKYTGENE